MQTQAISVAQTAPIFSNNISTLYPLAEHSKISGSYGKIILAWIKSLLLLSIFQSTNLMQKLKVPHLFSFYSC
jgi:hypothetical protein